MGTIRPSSAGTCPCPADGYTPGPDVVAIDYINGNPAEYGEFTMAISEFGIDTGDTEDELLREFLNLPDAGGGTDGTVTLKYKLGSGIKVSPSDPNYHIWRPYRLDCGCLTYDCSETTSTAEDSYGNVTDTIPCIIAQFIDENGELDFNYDQLTVAPTMVLAENYGVGDGTRLDGSIPNLMFFDPEIQHAIETYNGIPVNGRFDNYVDPYGIIYSAEWLISGATVDITTTIKDPRIIGEAEEQGRVERTGNTIRVIKRGMIGTIHEVIRVVDEGYVILHRSESSEEGEFQATFGCGDEYAGDPFYYHLDTNVLDQVEFQGGSDFVQDPEDDTTEFEWWPQVITDDEGNIISFQLFDSGHHGPIS